MAQRVKTAQHDRCLIPRTYTVEGHSSYHKTLLTSMHIKMNATKNKTKAALGEGTEKWMSRVIACKSNKVAMIGHET